MSKTSEKKQKKFISIGLTLFMVISLFPQLTIHAEEAVYTFDLFYGSISITSDTVTYYDSSSTEQTQSFLTGDELVITQTNSSSVASTASVTVNGGTESAPLNITLSGVNIDSTACAFKLINTSNVILTLDDGTENTLISSGYNAGLQVMSGTTLTINGNGSLDVTGGTNAAGIGGNGGSLGGAYSNGGNGGANGTLLINSGNITVNGNIGGGNGGNALDKYESSDNNTWTYRGGNGGNGGSITIAGGTIQVTENIGGGTGGNGGNQYYFDFGGDGGTGGNGGSVTIFGGTTIVMGSISGGNGGNGGCATRRVSSSGGDGGTGGSGSSVTVSGGTTQVTGNIGGGTGGNPGAGYGDGVASGSSGSNGGNGSCTITGGSFLAGTLKPTPTNGSDSVYLITVILDGLNAAYPMSSLTTTASYTYGIVDTITDANGQLYIWLSNGIKITGAQMLTGEYEGSITTTTAASSGTLYRALETDPPTVSSVTLNENYTPLSGEILITFSEAMDTSSGSVSLDGGITILSRGTWTNYNRTYTVSYYGLTNNTTYTVSISGFADISGNIMADNTDHSFNTIPSCGNGAYLIKSDGDSAYTAGYTDAGILNLMANDSVSGFTYFKVDISAVAGHSGEEVCVFVHERDGVQIGFSFIIGDFDTISSAGAAFNVQAGDVIEAYFVDALSNDVNSNPNVL